jgi:hypothetical protein
VAESLPSAAALAREVNDYTAELVAAQSDCFAFLALIPMRVC